MSLRAPASLDDVTPRWLTEVLLVAYPGLEVESVRLDSPIHGTATNVGMTVGYRSSGNVRPPTRLWLKGGYEQHFEYMAPSRIYEIEPLFFRELAPRLPIRVPRCHCAVTDETTHRGLVILDDLAAQGARFGNATRPIEPSMAAAVLQALARMHASTWQARWPAEHWYVQSGIPLAGPGALWYRDQTPEVFARYLAERAEAGVPASVNNPERIVRAFWKLAEMSRDEPLCLIHADAHLDNWYFEHDGTPGLMDWQQPRLGSWAWDVSYFLISALAIETRRQHERALLREYLETLAACGVAAPTFDEAWLAYRRYNAYGLFVKIVNPDMFKPREINLAWMSKHVAATEDLQTFESLGV